MRAGDKAIWAAACAAVGLCGAVGVGLPAFGQAAASSAAVVGTSHATATTGRVAVVPIPQPLRLGQPAELGLELKGPEAVEVYLLQQEVPVTGWTSSSRARLQRHADGSEYVTFVPMHTGTLSILVNVAFADSVMDGSKVQVQVVAADPPQQVLIEPASGDVPFVSLDLSLWRREQKLSVRAMYAGVAKPLPIENADVHYTVTMPAGEPSIRFDPATGVVRALQVGHALVESEVYGVKATECVVVTENAEAAGPRDLCRDLLKHGDGGVTAKEAAAHWFSQTGSKLPYGSGDRYGRFAADDRLEVQAPTHALQLAQESVLTLQLRGPRLVLLDCRVEPEGEPCSPGGSVLPGRHVALSIRPDGSGKVSVFPVTLRRQTYTFVAMFADGGVAVQQVSAAVELGDAAPRAVGKRCGSPSPMDNLPMRMPAFAGPSMNQAIAKPLVLTACYAGVPTQVVVPPNRIHYEVFSDGAEDVATVDAATGMLSVAHVGQALVRLTFAGMSSDTCVLAQSSRRGYDRNTSNCRALRAQHGADLPPLTALVRPVRVMEDIDPNAPPKERPAMEVKPVMMPWLASPASNPVPPVGPGLDPIDAATISSEVKDAFAADERLTLLSHGVTAVLDEWTRLPILLSGPAPIQINVYQMRLMLLRGEPDKEIEQITSVDDAGTDKIERGPDGRLWLNVDALRVGVAEFRVRILFADGGVAEQKVRLPVALPRDRTPMLIDNRVQGAGMIMPTETMHLTMEEKGRTWPIFPMVVFGDGGKFVALKAQDVKFSLVKPGKNPVVSVNAATGDVTALHVGHALVKTRFAGAEMETCVVVAQDELASEASTCEALR